MEILNYILDMGGSVVMPIIITIIGLIFGQKFSKAFRSGMTIGNRTHRNQPDHRADGRLCKSGSPGYGRTIRH